MRQALVYVGPGTDAGCVRALLGQLRLLAPAHRLQVATVGPAALRAGGWQRATVLLCLPGGRDLPYLRSLRGRAAAQIRRWVQGGGRFFGSCAGAYFAAEQINFAADKVPTVKGARPLRFFAGMAFGPTQAADAFAYVGTGGRRALRVRASADAAGALPYAVFNRGGCAFAPLPGRVWPQTARVLARAQVDGALLAPVAVRLQLGRGAALLWGAHPELPWPPAAACAGTRATQTAPSARLLRRHLAELLAGASTTQGAAPRVTHRHTFCLTAAAKAGKSRTASGA